MRRIVLAAALLALVAIGCKAEINLELQLEADGSGTIIAETGFDEEFQDFAFQGADPEEAIFEDNDLADLPNAEFSTFEQREFTFYQVRVPFENIEEVLAQTADSPLEGAEIVVTEDEVRISADTEDATGALFESDELEDFDPEILADTFAIHVRVLMPGEVTSHNADRVLDDGTLEWDVPLSGTGVSIEAVSDPTGGGDGIPVWLLAALGAGAVAVVGGGALAMRRRDKAEKGEEPVPVVAGVGVAAAGGSVVAGTPLEVPEATPHVPPPVVPEPGPIGSEDATVPPSAAPVVEAAEDVGGDVGDFSGGAGDEEPPPIT